MNFHLKQSKSKSIRDIPSYDFKRALSAAVTISTSCAKKTKSSTEIKNVDDADGEKECQRIQNAIKLRKFLAVAEKPPASFLKHKPQRLTSCSSDDGSNLTSFLSSRVRPKDYNYDISELTNSTDNFRAKKSINKRKCLKSNVLKSTSIVARSKRSSLSVSPSSHRKQYGSCRRSTVAVDSRDHKVESPKLSSTDKCLRLREKEMKKEHKHKHLRMREKGQHRSRSSKIREVVRIVKKEKCNPSPDWSIYSDQIMEEKLLSSYANSDDYCRKSYDEKNGRRDRKRDETQAWVSCTAEPMARYHGIDRERHKDWCHDNDESSQTKMSEYQKSNFPQSRCYSPIISRANISCRFWQGECASSKCTHDYFVERGDIYRRHIDPQSNKNTNNVPEIAQKPVEPMTRMKHPRVIDVQKNTKNLRASDGEIVDNALSDISDEIDDFIKPHREEQLDGPTDEFSVDKAREIPTLQTDTNETFENEKLCEISELSEAISGFSTEDGINDASLSSVSDEIAQNKTEEQLIDDNELDFEDISDCDLDEMFGEKEHEEKEPCIIVGPGDALGADWASLVGESNVTIVAQQKSKEIETSAKQRWQSHRILLDVGVSFKMAGTEFAQQKLAHATQQLFSVEPIDSKSVCTKMENGMNCELAKRRINQNKSLQLHPIAAAQVAANRFDVDLLAFQATGPYSRAVGVKREIAMRRQLCNLSINEKNSKTVSSPHTRYEDMAIKLFQKALATSRL